MLIPFLSIEQPHQTVPAIAPRAPQVAAVPRLALAQQKPVPQLSELPETPNQYLTRVHGHRKTRFIQIITNPHARAGAWKMIVGYRFVRYLARSLKMELPISGSTIPAVTVTDGGVTHTISYEDIVMWHGAGITFGTFRNNAVYAQHGDRALQSLRERLQVQVLSEGQMDDYETLQALFTKGPEHVTSELTLATPASECVRAMGMSKPGLLALCSRYST